MQLDSTLLPTVNTGSLLHLALGDSATARRLVAVTPPPGVMSNAPSVYARLGDTATAWRLVRAMEAAQYGDDPPEQMPTGELGFSHAQPLPV